MEQNFYHIQQITGTINLAQVNRIDTYGDIRKKLNFIKDIDKKIFFLTIL